MISKEAENIDSRELMPSSIRAADVVVSSLEQQILSGELQNDMPLPTERDLMKRFNASRTVIREAIAALSNRGLVESRPRFRPIVKKPNFTAALNAISYIVDPLLTQKGGVKNLYDSRVFLERALVRQAATSARRDDIHELRAALLANEQSINDSSQFYATDIAFHGVLYRIPQNPIFPAIHTGFISWLSPHWDRMQRLPDRNLVNFRSHEAIFLAIEDRDPDAAEEALMNHLKSAWEYVLVTFDENQL